MIGPKRPPALPSELSFCPPASPSCSLRIRRKSKRSLRRAHAAIDKSDSEISQAKAPLHSVEPLNSSSFKRLDRLPTASIFRLADYNHRDPLTMDSTDHQ